MSSSTVSFRPGQREALAFLNRHKRCNLHARMGFGKTFTTMTWLVNNAIDLTDTTLVIAPLRVARDVWPHEAAEFPHLNGLQIVPITGSEKERKAAMRVIAPVYAVNYDNLVWLVEHWGAKWPYRTVIADESTRLKSFRLRQGSKRAQALSKVAHKHTDRWINLTGLPAPNGLKDLWGQQWFIDGGRALGLSHDAFMQRWFYRAPKGDGKYQELLPHRHAQKEIEDAMRPTTMALDPRDWMDIKAPIETDVWVTLPPAARAQFQTMAKQFFADMVEGRVTASTSAVKSNKLLQLANGAIYYEENRWSWVHDEKIAALESIIEEAGGAPVLVAYSFRSDLERLRKAFPASRVLERTDESVVHDWNAGRVPLLFAHPKSAGHGLNLQHGGNILVYFGQDWNLEDHEQILERLGPTRQKQSGYDRPVYVYYIMARETLDATVRSRRDGKLAVVTALMQALKGLV